MGLDPTTVRQILSHIATTSTLPRSTSKEERIQLEMLRIQKMFERHERITTEDRMEYGYALTKKGEDYLKNLQG